MALTQDQERLFVDRFAFASMAEAMRLVDEGIASAKDIDLAMRAGAGYAKGPLEQADEIGLDAVLEKLRLLQSKYGENYTPTATLEKLVATGALGKKSGRGYHSYAPEQSDGARPVAQQPAAPPAPPPAAKPSAPVARPTAAPSRPAYPTFTNILVDIGDAIALVTINRPPANSLSRATLEELSAAFELLEADMAVRAVIITGAGQYVFIGGADITEFVGLDAAGTRASVERGHALLNAIEHCAKPVIAAVNGVCVGGGNELAMACDFRIAAESAQFGQPEVGLGIIPGWGGTQRLTRIVGKGRALELMMTGDRMPADVALRYGLVNKVVPDNEVLAAARNVARKLAAQAPLSIAAIKHAVNAGLDFGAGAGYEAELQGVLRIFGSDDAREGVSAFLEKRRPKFTGS